MANRMARNPRYFHSNSPEHDPIIGPGIEEGLVDDEANVEGDQVDPQGQVEGGDQGGLPEQDHDHNHHAEQNQDEQEPENDNNND
ncbi:hypothetical protein EDD11_010363 [Mortierella claussenii]|nr:hypothetical protein EDD11_010363 [Mortierella claussenii]